MRFQFVGSPEGSNPQPRTQPRAVQASPPESHSTDSSSGVTLIGEREYRLICERMPRTIFRLGTRLLSPDVTEVLSRSATRKRYNWADLCDYLKERPGRRLPKSWRLRQLLYATFLNHMIFGNDESLEISHLALRSAVRHAGFGKVSDDYRLWQICVSVAALSEDSQLVSKLRAMRESDDESVGWQAEMDLELARVRRWHPRELAAWWSKFNTPFVALGVEAWKLKPTARNAPLFDRIHAPVVRGCSIPQDRQPLISVLVSTYNPGRSFLQTIESLCRQSWRNLEILIIDDASVAGSEIIEKARRMDRRVRVIRLAENGGAYRARNVGLAEAAGEYVTFLDADDLAHPRRLEYQATPMLERSELVATTSRSLRMYGNGRITSFATPPFRENVSSLMFKRERALKVLGFYDEVRKAADSEYVERLERIFGDESLLHMPLPLSLVQLTVGSLSRNDFRGRANWISGVRVAYRMQYRGWHRRLDAASDLLPLPQSASRRPFVAPAKLLGGDEPSQVGFVVVGEWADYLDTVNLIAAQMEDAASRMSEPIGLLNGVSLRETRSVRRLLGTSASVCQLVEEGRASWMSWAQRTSIDTLVFDDPEHIMLLPANDQIGVSARRVIVRLGRLIPARENGVGILDPAMVEERCLRAFGTEPDWLPANEQLAEHLGSVPASRVLPAGDLASLVG